MVLATVWMHEPEEHHDVNLRCFVNLKGNCLKQNNRGATLYKCIIRLIR